MKLVFLAGALLLTAEGMAGADARVDASGHLIRDHASCGTTRIAAPIATPFIAPAAPAGARTIFLNRNGGTYQITSGATNSATNTANRLAAGDNQSHANVVIPPIDASFDWPGIVACVKQHYKLYNVVFTETEPASGSYIEAVVGGTGSNMGYGSGSGILGVAAADNFCGVTERGIAFSFATNHKGITKANEELCATIAHEVGHLVALEHEIAGPDTMSYVPFAAVNQKSFTTANSQCGTDSQNVSGCSCQTTGAGQVTNSSVRLKAAIGLRPTETTPPTLTVMSPGDASTLKPTFEVVANATDETEMDRVAVLVDGNEVGSSAMPDGTTYTIGLVEIAEGPHTLTVQAVDFSGNVTTRQLAITVARLATGETCVSPDDCHGDVCVADGDTNYCTEVCTGDSCPSGFSCTAVGAQNLCVPSEGGGCAVGGGGPAFGLLLIGGLLVILRRRR